ncbi:MAG: SDR family oxidoreductase [Aphanocapsa sp. GSE-SYN-MK-11-07L]|nr:SDR family oxidoreductase [Aphanocapsa sp. GSE-SYN-MK-11-07L]
MNGSEIAIIGMSGRFPGANNLDQFWQNLCNGVESVSFLSDEELLGSGVNPALLHDPNYVKAKALLADIDRFDAHFFGFSPKEAETMDPQHRLFLEHAWDAIEQAGYNPETYEGSIGVYAGVETSTYLINNLCPDSGGIADLQMFLGNAVDYLSTRVSYKVNLKGPSVTIQTACSTSLVAVHVACQSLLNGECDMALAGGVSITVPQKVGYVYQTEGISSPDGHCRAFDAKAQGTIFSSGLGIVLLKRLSDAIADGDFIDAIVKGSAINNDGSFKVGYTAPSSEGQAAAIAEAQAIAGIDAGTITYIEAHGTGTALGDPIELTALTQVFRRSTDQKGGCAIGSVKTNVGHLSVAAGITGLIKTVLSLKHQWIPPSLNFEHPNPKIDFADSPFYVNTELSQWKTNQIPRRAGVSSFGMGGTNAHVILEEALPVSPSPASRPWQLLILSAKTDSALEQATVNLVNALKQTPDLNLADVAYTLQIGRQAFDCRRVFVCQTLEQAVKALEDPQSKSLLTQNQEVTHRPIVFMFSGQGAQHVNMARELYEVEPTFRQQVDLGLEILRSHLGVDLRHILYPDADSVEAASQQLKQTAIAQPALFVIEYALAQLWMEWGVRPTAMIGHSIGEYVAATLAGVFSFEDALALVVARASLMQQLPSGSMLAIPLPEQDVTSLLDNSLSLAAINGPSACVVSGVTEAIESLQNKLAAQGIDCRCLQTSHAFHSEMMEPILLPFMQRVQQVKLNPPQIPYLSNVTGTWITAQETTDPSYWAKHLRQTVRFAAGLDALLQDPNRILLEVGPGRTLMTFAKRHPNRVNGQGLLTSLRHPQESESDMAFLLQTVGQLWLSGVAVSWSGFYTHEQRFRVPLPTYPFERQRYWVEPVKSRESDRPIPPALSKKSDIADWFYLPCWKPSILPSKLEKLEVQTSNYLVFIDECGFGTPLVEYLKNQGQNVVVVKCGTEFTQLSESLYTLNPQHADDYDALLKEQLTAQKQPHKVIHLWNLTAREHTTPELTEVKKAHTQGFYSLLYLVQALEKQLGTDEVEITVVSNHTQIVTGEEWLAPEKATLLGMMKVIPQEYFNLHCRSIDVVLPASGSWQAKKLINDLFNEFSVPMAEPMIVYRGTHRYVQAFEPVRLEETFDETSVVRSRLRNGGVYLITGGLGEIGRVIARHLAETVQAKLILTGRSAFPARTEWEDWLISHNQQSGISRKIQDIQAIEALGAEVLVVSADVANLEQMRDAIAKAESRFGSLNGVIHAAGIVETNSFVPMTQLTKIACEQQFQPKVYGLLVLEKVLRDQALDFCLLLSSLSSVLGGLGYAAYASANLFMDAFAQQQNQTHPVPWISVNWDAWKVGQQTQQDSSHRTSLAEFAIAPIEGVKVLERILSGIEFNPICVSTGDLQTRLKQWTQPSALHKKRSNSTSVNISPLHARPNLQNAYVPPKTTIEETLANIWQEILGIQKIGIHDNFFELGGDSLLSTQVLSQLRKRFQMELSVNSMFETPTVAGISEAIEKTYRTAQPLPVHAGIGEREEGEL